MPTTAIAPEKGRRFHVEDGQVLSTRVRRVRQLAHRARPARMRDVDDLDAVAPGAAHHSGFRPGQPATASPRTPIGRRTDLYFDREAAVRQTSFVAASGRDISVRTRAPATPYRRIQPPQWSVAAEREPLPTSGVTAAGGHGSRPQMNGFRQAQPTARERGARRRRRDLQRSDRDG